MKSTEVIEKIFQALDDNCDKPSEEMVKLGKVFIEIGTALKGQSLSDSRAILEAVKSMNQIRKAKE